MKYDNGWITIRFAVSPELFSKLQELKGKDRKWWEFFRDEYEGKTVSKKPVVRDLEAEARAHLEEQDDSRR